MEKEQSEKGGKARLRDRLCRSLDLLPDVFSGECLVEIRAGRVLTLYGGGRILAYTPEQIEVSLKSGSLCVIGTDLVCLSYHVDAIEIEGKIISVSFKEET